MAFFNSFYHTKDHSFIQSSPAERKKKGSYGRAEKYPGQGAPWFWGGGDHMPMPPPNGIPHGPLFMGRGPWDGSGAFCCSGKPPAAQMPPSGKMNLDPGPRGWGGNVEIKETVNSGPGAGGLNSGKMSGRINYHHYGTKPAGENKNAGRPRYTNEYLIINQGVGAGRINSGPTEGSINNFHGTIEF